MTTTDTQQLERASVAAPRPELDWERDWQGRPRILPDPTWTPETAPPGWVQNGQLLESREYTRVTTFAEALQDSSALTRWKGRRIVLGMGRRPDYVVTAASLTAEDRDRDALDDLAEKALEASGPNAADVGTALHAFTDRIDRGEELGEVPEQYRPTLDAYRHAVSVLRFVEWECRTVCDELETGGTPDRLGFCTIPDPDGVTDALRIIDTKTGRVDYSAGKFSTQLAIYRRSRKYHPGTGARTSWEELHGQPVSRWGLVVHIPAGAGTAELLWINLEHGDHGAEAAKVVRQWRQGATAGKLLQPVFARPPRPATTDGTCRGRKQDGAPCGYRRKSKVEGLGSQFCGRHQDQAAGLERWLAENPGTDPAAGVEEEPSRRPVQPSSPAVVASEAAGASDAAQRAADAAAGTPAEQQLVAAAAAMAAAADVAESFDRPARLEDDEAAADGTDDEVTMIVLHHAIPNGRVKAPPGTWLTSNDGTRWLKVQREDTYGWEREERVVAAGGPELVRCAGSGLLVTQCACSVHRPEQADLAAAAYAQAAGIAQEQQAAMDRPVRELPDEEWRAAAARTLAPQHQRILAEVAPVVSPEQLEEQQLDGDDAYPDYGPEDDAAAAMGLPSQTVGTYALDPDTEQNGNRRPVSGLQTPDDARDALRKARAALFDLIDACNSETELQLLWQRHSAIWTEHHTARAAERSRQLVELHQLERPGAALLAALENAPDMATLERLFTQYGQHVLWTPEVGVVAQRRWEQLQYMAQL